MIEKILIAYTIESVITIVLAAILIKNERSLTVKDLLFYIFICLLPFLNLLIVGYAYGRFSIETEGLVFKLWKFLKSIKLKIVSGLNYRIK